jgi:alpha-D-ribose 1-methylphosphonate 5-triphosphate diphosphatase PhnM
MARLQKKDLAKEFSDLVQQEVKNHNDSMLATNQALNEMRQKLEEFKENCEIKSAAFQNTCSLQLGAFGVLRDRFEQSMAKLQREVNDHEKQRRVDLISLRKSFEDRETYYMTITGFDQFNVKMDQWTANIQRAFNVQQDSSRQQTDRICEETRNAIEILRKAVQKSIDEEIAERKEQDVTLDHFAVNFAGMQREIEIVKKRCFIIEKNIENLYTQIERVKEAR